MEKSFLKSFVLLLFLLLSKNGFTQISIIPDKPEVITQTAFVYDSLSNLKEQKEGDGYGYRHLKGQTMLYMGDPWHYYYRNPSVTIGHYFKITNVVPYTGAYGRPYRVLEIEDTATHEKASVDCYIHKRNEQWVVLGYYEKMKKIYVGKSLVFRDFAGYRGYSKHDGIILMSNDSAIQVKNGTVWKCTDVSVRPRTAKEWKYELNDNRSPVVLVIENPTYGKCYCYLEDKFGGNFDITNSVYKDSNYDLPLICGKFTDKTLYDKAIALNKQQRAKRLAVLTQKYGKANANLIIKGSIKIGMTKQMCRESWGTPDDINRTILEGSTYEQWVYGSSYVYFTGNRITAIQN